MARETHTRIIGALGQRSEVNAVSVLYKVPEDKESKTQVLKKMLQFFYQAVPKSLVLKHYFKGLSDSLAIFWRS